MNFNSFFNLKANPEILSNVNHPPHYKLNIEPIIYITANNLNFIEGNIIKYVSRYKNKNGKEDLLKAKFYLEYLIKNYE
jgi:hypothetical protein